MRAVNVDDLLNLAQKRSREYGKLSSEFKSFFESVVADTPSLDINNNTQLAVNELEQVRSEIAHEAEMHLDGNFYIRYSDANKIISNCIVQLERR